MSGRTAYGLGKHNVENGVTKAKERYTAKGKPFCELSLRKGKGRSMKAILSVIFLGLLTSVAVAQDRQAAPQPTTFMGHQLGETVQQWLCFSDQPKKCSPFSTASDRKSVPTIRFCNTVKNIAGGGEDNSIPSIPEAARLQKITGIFRMASLLR